jgi:NADPH2:quinone reductase
MRVVASDASNRGRSYTCGTSAADVENSTAPDADVSPRQGDPRRKAVMKAAQVTALGGPSAIVVRDVAEPPRPPGKVLIEVHAAGVIFPDVLKSQGRYQDRPALPFLAGHQASGVVLAAPARAPVRVGDRIVALTESGAFAERAVADPERVFPLPDAMSFAAGAAAPINYLTTHFALSWRARLQAGETVLVHGAAGGLGSAAVQYARVLGARVIAVVSTPEKAVLARQSGAHETVAATAS